MREQEGVQGPKRPRHGDAKRSPAGWRQSGGAGLARQIEAGVAQQGNDLGAVVDMNQTGILPEVDLLGTMAPIFNKPLASSQL